MTTKQLPAGQLPLEIWMIIVDMAVEASVIPDKVCNYCNFPRMNEQLHPSYNVPRLAESWSNLRLVSRQFKALSGLSPYCYMYKRIEVQHGARSVCLDTKRLRIVPCMQLLASSPNADKIAALKINYLGAYNMYPYQNLSEEIHLGVLPYAS
jgi:hypothetical protein